MYERYTKQSQTDVPFATKMFLVNDEPNSEEEEVVEENEENDGSVKSRWIIGPFETQKINLAFETPETESFDSRLEFRIIGNERKYFVPVKCNLSFVFFLLLFS